MVVREGYSTGLSFAQLSFRAGGLNLAESGLYLPRKFLRILVFRAN